MLNQFNMEFKGGLLSPYEGRIQMNLPRKRFAVTVLDALFAVLDRPRTGEQWIVDWASTSPIRRVALNHHARQSPLATQNLEW
jgi:hypothetical protein